MRLAREEYVKARIRGDANKYSSVGARLDDGSRIEIEANGDSLAFFLYLFRPVRHVTEATAAHRPASLPVRCQRRGLPYVIVELFEIVPQFLFAPIWKFFQGREIVFKVLFGH